MCAARYGGPVPDVDESALDVFETQRRYLGAVAYRLPGSLSDAQDVLQEAWLRRQAVGHGTVDDPRAFLTTVVTRLCYDQLGSARARREAYYGEWLPEPLVSEDAGPDELAELGESVSLAVLAVMEQLSPAERAALVLHDVFAVGFAVGFEEIAATLDRSPEVHVVGDAAAVDVPGVGPLRMSCAEGPGGPDGPWTAEGRCIGRHVRCSGPRCAVG